MAGCFGIIFIVVAILLIAKLLLGGLGIVVALLALGVFLLWVEGS